MNLLKIVILSVCTLLISSSTVFCAGTSPLWRKGINVIPTPGVVRLGDGAFSFGRKVVHITVRGKRLEADLFAAQELAARLNSDFGIEAQVVADGMEGEIILTDSRGEQWRTGQSYTLEAGPQGVRIEADGPAGLFYGTRTLLQLITQGLGGYELRAVRIEDKPDIVIRAVHYDTKHHQDRMEYLRGFIRDLADYKINMLIWEWEDKFAYLSHPEIGAPGAFTADEIRELTRYALDYHIQLVPLIQGLGHVSYILKWPGNTHLREVEASNWEFCPLKEGSYELLFDLWREAIDATPGVEYLHIGSDETFELGLGKQCDCAEHVNELGRYSFYMQFVNRCAEYIVSQGRSFIAWTPAYRPEEKIRPPKQGPLMAEVMDLELARKGMRDGYTHWVYTPNPGLEQPFLPYFYREGRHPGTTLENAYETLTIAASSGLFEGMIVASWDDSGLHNQVWMMRFVNAAEYGWSGAGPSLEEFNDKYFTNYYGPDARDMRELFDILNRGAYYFMDSFERKVWHWGEIGKTHLPDLPRGDAFEYDPYWNTEYRDMVERSGKQLAAMERAINICRTNTASGVRHAADMEVYESIAELIAHNARTYLALSELETTITRAHRQRFVSHQATHAALLDAAVIIERNLDGRKRMFDSLVAVWEKSRLPKGMDTASKKFFHRQDRTRHFANRRADMTYLICDEQKLGLENYLTSLRQYSDWYAATYLTD